MKFNICVAIPIKSSDIGQYKSTVKEALEANPEFIELRFDYMNDINSLTSEFIKELKKLIQTNISVIFTMRSHSEGGQINIIEKERLEIIKRLIEAHPDYLDIEMKSDTAILKEIINLTQRNNVNLIFSSHDFNKTPSYEESKEIVSSFLDKLVNDFQVDTKYVNEFVYKIIFTAQNFDDNLVPLELCKAFSEDNKKIISFCMGKFGIFSRIACVKVGSFLTYASLAETTAPGQIHVKKIRKFYNLIFNNL
ncbi:MAG: type I 3-dehydroquinate dehydratase [Promethearchaeota archaeon]|nr:MAG: type I 3-dehydroquinate dehydratase [Candidatus Lokiarchaeota archaeon]